MFKFRKIVALPILLVAFQVQAVEQNNRGELTASEGVKKIFEDPNVDEVAAGRKIRCVRHRRVGTHMITKTCMTVKEWGELQRANRDNHQNNFSNGLCGASSATTAQGSFNNTSVPGALLPTGCGESINRGG
jgi:hypothetical protein